MLRHKGTYTNIWQTKYNLTFYANAVLAPLLADASIQKKIFWPSDSRYIDVIYQPCSDCQIKSTSNSKFFSLKTYTQYELQETLIRNDFAN